MYLCRGLWTYGIEACRLESSLSKKWYKNANYLASSQVDHPNIALALTLIIGHFICRFTVINKKVVGFSPGSWAQGWTYVELILFRIPGISTPLFELIFMFEVFWRRRQFVSRGILAANSERNAFRKSEWTKKMIKKNSCIM